VSPDGSVICLNIENGGGRPIALRLTSAELDRNETTTSELLARHLPKSNIVKAFNAIQPADIVNGRPAGSPKRRAHPIAGNGAAAKEVVTRLLAEFGFDVVDAGERPLPELWFG
jgi:8-hydroxy-5-deazaflavin:NADPH oxidoreductase